MSRLNRLRSLTGDERRLLLGAVLLSVVIRVALLIMPFRTVRRALAPWRSLGRRGPGCASLDDIGNAVITAGRHVPGSTCLTEALVGETLLYRRGFPARLCLGATRDGDTLRAHAWVVSEGTIVIGEHADAYTPLVGRGEAQL
jgi:Transglutaminase-like superfamily